MSDRSTGALFLLVAIAGALLVAWMLYIPGYTWWSLILSYVGGSAIGFGLVFGVASLRGVR